MNNKLKILLMIVAVVLVASRFITIGDKLEVREIKKLHYEYLDLVDYQNQYMEKYDERVMEWLTADPGDYDIQELESLKTSGETVIGLTENAVKAHDRLLLKVSEYDGIYSGLMSDLVFTKEELEQSNAEAHETLEEIKSDVEFTDSLIDEEIAEFYNSENYCGDGNIMSVKQDKNKNKLLITYQMKNLGDNDIRRYFSLEYKDGHLLNIDGGILEPTDRLTFEQKTIDINDAEDLVGVGLGTENCDEYIDYVDANEISEVTINA